MDETLAMMQALTEAHGVPGQEDEVRTLMGRYLQPYGELISDGLGSLVVRYPGGAGEEGPRVLLASHMDEVGFLVTAIDDDGYIRFQPLGGWWEQVVLAQRVRVATRRGPFPGVVGAKPPHILSLDERKKVVEGRSLYIDIGVTSRRDALAAGVRPGDPITPLCPFTVMANPKVLMAKAWDDRAGCALVIETLRLLAAGPAHPNVVYAGGTVQEEIGLRGATTLTHLLEPAIGIAYDVGIAGDTPGVTPCDAQGRLGQGALIFIYDGSLVPNPRLRDLVIDVAEEEGIPYQFDTMPGGGEDAGRMALSRGGMPAICLGVPARYIHSAASLIHRDDFDAAARLGAALIRRLDASTVATLRG
jgi:endoglucanase